MISKFRVFNKSFGEWLDAQEIVFCGGELFHDWITFEDGIPLNMRDCAVMQSTGLKDKNDVEIFEGDIFKEGYGQYLVVWDAKNARFALKYVHCFEEIFYLGMGNIEGMNLIGNIYENPDLLEAE